MPSLCFEVTDPPLYPSLVPFLSLFLFLSFPFSPPSSPSISPLFYGFLICSFCPIESSEIIRKKESTLYWCHTAAALERLHKSIWVTYARTHTHILYTYTLSHTHTRMNIHLFSECRSLQRRDKYNQTLALSFSIWYETSLCTLVVITSMSTHNNISFCNTVQGNTVE